MNRRYEALLTITCPRSIYLENEGETLILDELQKMKNVLFSKGTFWFLKAKKHSEYPCPLNMFANKGHSKASEIQIIPLRNMYFINQIYK